MPPLTEIPIIIQSFFLLIGPIHNDNKNYNCIVAT